YIVNSLVAVGDIDILVLLGKPFPLRLELLDGLLAEGREFLEAGGFRGLAGHELSQRRFESLESLDPTTLYCASGSPSEAE
ncbi:MAG: hypothetical protein GTO55_03560, partial [Armatimonadetes bacterium]|nr:hypothetical protein [Armatimonadota bacterium]NIM23352.1 hypothetical protein [Armatimonadota bacterium]NIM67216.1 hypothetical protein [Armatimonadota bacterium]NIO96531.1 hypothetical protein [Armatimonadota bacterium]NIT30759.1 hypothetical protein [Armatimonadota bacterium]